MGTRRGSCCHCHGSGCSTHVCRISCRSYGRSLCQGEGQSPGTQLNRTTAFCAIARQMCTRRPVSSCDSGLTGSRALLVENEPATTVAPFRGELDRYPRTDELEMPRLRNATSSGNRLLAASSATARLPRCREARYRSAKTVSSASAATTTRAAKAPSEAEGSRCT